MDETLHAYSARHGEDGWDQAYPFNPHQSMTYTAFGVNPNMLNGYHNHSSSHSHAYTNAYHQSHASLPYTAEEVKPQPYFIDSRTGQAFSSLASPSTSKSASNHYAALTAFNEHVYASRRRDHAVAAAIAAEEEAYYKAAFQEMVCMPDDDEDEVTEGNAGLSEGASSTTVENSPKSVLDHEDEAQGLRAASSVPSESADRAATTSAQPSAPLVPVIANSSGASMLSAGSRPAPTGRTAASEAISGSTSGSTPPRHWRTSHDRSGLSLSTVATRNLGLPSLHRLSTSATPHSSGAVSATAPDVSVSTSLLSTHSQNTSISVTVRVTSGPNIQAPGSANSPIVRVERRQEDEQSDPASSQAGDDNEPPSTSAATSVKDEPVTPIVVDKSLPLAIDLRSSTPPPTTQPPDQSAAHEQPPASTYGVNPTELPHAAPHAVDPAHGERSATPALSPRVQQAHPQPVIPPHASAASPLPPLDIPTTGLPSRPEDRSLTPSPSTARADYAHNLPNPENPASTTRLTSRPAVERSRTPSPSPTKIALASGNDVSDAQQNAVEPVTTYSPEEDSETSRLSTLAELAIVHLSPPEKTETQLEPELTDASKAASSEEPSTTAPVLTEMEIHTVTVSEVHTDGSSETVKMVEVDISLSQALRTAEISIPEDDLAELLDAASKQTGQQEETDDEEPVVTVLPTASPSPAIPAPNSYVPRSEDPMPTSEAAVEDHLALPSRISAPSSSQGSNRSFQAIFATLPSSSPSNAARAAYFSDDESNEEAAAEEHADDVSSPEPPAEDSATLMDAVKEAEAIVAELQEAAWAPSEDVVQLAVEDTALAAPGLPPLAEETVLAAQDLPSLAEETLGITERPPSAADSSPSAPSEGIPLASQPLQQSKKRARMVLDYILVPVVPRTHRQQVNRLPAMVNPYSAGPSDAVEPNTAVHATPSSSHVNKQTPTGIQSPNPFLASSPLPSGSNTYHPRILKRPRNSTSPVDTPVRPKKRVRLTTPIHTPPSLSPSTSSDGRTRSRSSKRLRSSSPSRGPPAKRIRNEYADEIRFPTAEDGPRTRNTLLPRPVSPFQVKKEVDPIIIPKELANGIINLVDDGSDDELGVWEDVEISFVSTSKPSPAIIKDPPKRVRRLSPPTATIQPEYESAPLETTGSAAVAEPLAISHDQSEGEPVKETGEAAAKDPEEDGEQEVAGGAVDHDEGSEDEFIKESSVDESESASEEEFEEKPVRRVPRGGRKAVTRSSRSVRSSPKKTRAPPRRRSVRDIHPLGEWWISQPTSSSSRKLRAK